MGKRKTQPVNDLIDSAGEDEHAEEDYKPKKRKTPVKAKPADGKTPAAKKRAAPRPKVTEPTQTDDGWTLHPPSLIYKIADAQPGDKIAGFDFDGTLAVTKSGAEFALRADDWKLYNSKVPEVVQQYAADGYKIVIFSNQGGIKSALNGKSSENQRGRFNGVIGKLEVPVTAFMATMPDDNRKPATGMWDFFLREGNGSQAPDLEQSFFVGDAAGRDGDKVGSSDRDFAEAIGIGFKTPEEVFGPGGSGGASGAGPVLDATGPNADLANIFTQLADHFKAEPFKARAFRNSSQAMVECETKITSEQQAKKLKLKGIGKGSLAVIKEFLETGQIAILDPTNIAKEEATAKAEAKNKAGGDAFLFL